MKKKIDIHFYKKLAPLMKEKKKLVNGYEIQSILYLQSFMQYTLQRQANFRLDFSTETNTLYKITFKKHHCQQR